MQRYYPCARKAFQNVSLRFLFVAKSMRRAAVKRRCNGYPYISGTQAGRYRQANSPCLPAEQGLFGYETGAVWTSNSPC